MKHRVVAMLILLCAITTSARAQDLASSFEQLRVLVKPDDRITVIDGAGRRTKGRVDRLSDTELVLVTKAGPERFDEEAVDRILHRRDDSLLNGAIIGAAVSTACFVTAGVLLSDSNDGNVIVSSVITGGLMFAGMGAGAGAGFDALITRRQVIYRRAARDGRFGLAPLLGRDRWGATVMLQF